MFCVIWDRFRRVAPAGVHFVPRAHNRRTQRPRTFHSHKTSAKTAPPAPCTTRGLPSANRGLVANTMSASAPACGNGTFENRESGGAAAVTLDSVIRNCAERVGPAGPTVPYPSQFGDSVEVLALSAGGTRVR
jgi:hypothetical protein